MSTKVFSRSDIVGEGDIAWSWGSGYVGVLLNVLFSMLTIVIHVLTPSPLCFDDSMYEVRVLQDVIEHLDEDEERRAV